MAKLTVRRLLRGQLHNVAWTAQVDEKSHHWTCTVQTHAVQSELYFHREGPRSSDPPPPHLYQLTQRKQAPFAFS